MLFFYAFYFLRTKLLILIVRSSENTLILCLINDLERIKGYKTFFYRDNKLQFNKQTAGLAFMGNLRNLKESGRGYLNLEFHSAFCIITLKIKKA